MIGAFDKENVALSDGELKSIRKNCQIYLWQVATVCAPLDKQGAFGARSTGRQPRDPRPCNSGTVPLVAIGVEGAGEEPRLFVHVDVDRIEGANLRRARFDKVQVRHMAAVLSRLPSEGEILRAA